MKGNTALRVAITGANGNIGRKLIAALLAAPDIAAGSMRGVWKRSYG
jgi:nucleoside-diphosphate-sugar epimerase